MRLIVFLMLLSLALSPALPFSATADEEAVLLLDPALIADRFYSNPIDLKNIGDPFILAEEGMYYAYATSGGTMFPVWQSETLQAFENRKQALRGVLWAWKDFWAPEVYYHQGRYVMVYSARRLSDDSLRVGIAFADHPEGPYQDLGRELFDFGYAAIDGSLFFDTDGTPYLFYSRDCSENVVNGRHESHSYGVRLNDALTETVGKPVLLIRPDLPWELHSGDWLWNEGPVVLMHDGRYYLFYSANYYASKEYGLGYAVADHPLGPYVKPSNNRLLRYLEEDGEVLISGPGHNAFFMAGEELFTSYHTHSYPLAPSGNRQLNLNRAGFHRDGTSFVNGPSLGLCLRPLKDLGLINAAVTARLTASGEDGELLRDGDECTAYSGYAWKPADTEAWALFEWPDPISTDCILVFTPPGQTGPIKLLLNGRYSLHHDMSDSRQPGEPIILHFEQMALHSLQIEISAGQQIGEITVLAKP